MCLHTRGDFQERRSTAADWLHDDFLRLDTAFCVQLTLTYSTVDTAKCICIFFNTNVFWSDVDVLKGRNTLQQLIHTLSCIDCC